MIQIRHSLILPHRGWAYILSLLLFPAISLAGDVSNGSFTTMRQDMSGRDLPSVTSLKYIDDFNFQKTFKGMLEDYSVYTFRDYPDNQYLIKSKNRDSILRDFVGAFVLHKIAGPDVPLNFLVKLKNGDIALASRIIDNFVSYRSYLERLNKNDPKVNKLSRLGCLGLMSDYPRESMSQNVIVSPICKIEYSPARFLHYSSIITRLNLLSRFIGYVDYHCDNVGFVVINDKVTDGSLIDFDSSLFFDDEGDFVPPKNYFTSLDELLVTLTLICSFNIDTLDQLAPLFDHLGERQFLEQTKNSIANQISKFKKELEVCEYLKKVTTNEYSDERLERLITIGIDQDILNRYTLETGDNILINFLATRKDVARLVKVLMADRNLAICFVTCCLKNNQRELLLNTVLRLDQHARKTIVKELLGQVKTSEQLQLVCEVLEATKLYPTLLVYTKKITEHNCVIEELLKEYENLFCAENFCVVVDNEYLHLIKFLMIICLQEIYNNDIREIANHQDRKLFLYATWDHYLLQEDQLNIFIKYIPETDDVIRLINEAVYYDMSGILQKMLDEPLTSTHLDIRHTAIARGDTSLYAILSFKKDLIVLIDQVLDKMVSPT